MQWEVDFNKSVAKYFAKQIVYEGNRPVVPHLFYTQFLDDSFDYERNMGLTFGQLDLTECDEFLLVVIDGVISAGMKGEIAVLSRLGKRGRIVSMTKAEIREAMKVTV